MTALTDLTLWFHDRVCVGHNSPTPYCTGAGRTKHARLHRDKAKRALATTTLDEMAELLHSELCPMEMQAAHGAHYVKMRDEACGDNGIRHIAHLRKHPLALKLHPARSEGTAA